MRELDEHLLRPLADEDDLAHVLHPQEPLAGVLGDPLEFGRGVVGPGEGVHGHVHVAVLVVEERPGHALRQRVLDVPHLLAHLIPDVRHGLRRRVVAELHRDDRLTGQRVRPQVVEVRGLLKLLLDLVGHLPLHLVARRPRPVGRDDHRLDGERRVFGPAHPEVGVQPGGGDREDQVQDDGRVLHRPRGQVRRRSLGFLPRADESPPGRASGPPP